jgi:hypothetical protein
MALEKISWLSSWDFRQELSTYSKIKGVNPNPEVHSIFSTPAIAIKRKINIISITIQLVRHK